MPEQQADCKNAVIAKVSFNLGKKAELQSKAIEHKATNPAVKVPRLPNPPSGKGATKMEKASNTQQEANMKQQERKAAGKVKFASAVAAYEATTNLTNCKHVYNGQWKYILLL